MPLFSSGPYLYGNDRDFFWNSYKTKVIVSFSTCQDTWYNFYSIFLPCPSNSHCFVDLENLKGGRVVIVTREIRCKHSTNIFMFYVLNDSGCIFSHFVKPLIVLVEMDYISSVIFVCNISIQSKSNSFSKIGIFISI